MEKKNDPTSIHEEMLKDTTRTLSYYDSILQNTEDFKGKVVLDVGCGTGILSLFAAKAGAKKVIGVEMSKIINQARQIVKDNGFEDVITLIEGKIEEVELPVEKVDIIVSEWMGYFLLYETMFPSVLWARDKWLAKDGRLLPEVSKLYICGIEDKEYKEEKIGFWDNVYGFDFKCIKELAFVEPLVDTVQKEQTLESSKCKPEDLDFEADFVITAKYTETLHAFCVYFDIEFLMSQKNIHFTTSPFAGYTHWRQTVFYLKRDIKLRKGEKVKGRIFVKANKKNKRDLDISISIDFKGVFQNFKGSQDYRLR